MNPADDLDLSYVNLYIQCEKLLRQIRDLPGGTSRISDGTSTILPLGMEQLTLPAKILFLRHKKEKLETLLATLQRHGSNDPPPLNSPPKVGKLYQNVPAKTSPVFFWQCCYEEILFARRPLLCAVLNRLFDDRCKTCTELQQLATRRGCQRTRFR
jgi:hypothetical protein